MANKIQIKRGRKADMPQLSAGELGLAVDTDEVFIGNGDENMNIPVNITIDSELSDISENPVQNKAVFEALGNKQETITGSASSITKSNLPLSRVLVSNASGKVTASSITSTQLSYLSGVSKNIQNQLNSKKRAVTLAIGASASGHTAADVDYLCDGTDDQEQINAAIAAISDAGGKIILLEGTYNISDSINITKENVSIEGMGVEATTLQTNSFTGNIIRASQPYFTLKNVRVTSTMIEPTGIGINFLNNGSHGLIDNVEVYGLETGVRASGYNIIINKVRADFCGMGILANKNCMVTNCIIIDSDGVGIRVSGNHGYICGNYIDSVECGIEIAEGRYNKISDNYIIRGLGETSDYTETQYTISVYEGTYNDISNNYILGKNYITIGGTGNTFVNNRYE
ncbi:MAG: hypothetical protein HFE49_07265 [Clostridia bacterium]|nr:hypothetical protein [Clostridia bacterium]